MRALLAEHAIFDRPPNPRGTQSSQDGEVEEITAEKLFKGRKVVVFGLPGEAGEQR